MSAVHLGLKPVQGPGLGTNPHAFASDITTCKSFSAENLVQLISFQKVFRSVKRRQRPQIVKDEAAVLRRKCCRRD